MRNVGTLALASGAALALALGGAALAQDNKPPQQKHAHGDAEHAKNHAQHMQRMEKMHDKMHGNNEKHEEHEKQEQSPR